MTELVCVWQSSVEHASSGRLGLLIQPLNHKLNELDLAKKDTIIPYIIFVRASLGE